VNVPLSQTFRLRIAHGHTDVFSDWCHHTLHGEHPEGLGLQARQRSPLPVPDRKSMLCCSSFLQGYPPTSVLCSWYK
jgi:hypothetical protein